MRPVVPISMVPGSFCAFQRDRCCLGSWANPELEQLASTIPARRVTQATEMVGAAVYFASDEANYVHGTTLPVDGGASAI